MVLWLTSDLSASLPTCDWRGFPGPECHGPTMWSVRQPDELIHHPDFAPTVTAEMAFYSLQQHQTGWLQGTRREELTKSTETKENQGWRPGQRRKEDNSESWAGVWSQIPEFKYCNTRDAMSVLRTCATGRRGCCFLFALGTKMKLRAWVLTLGWPGLTYVAPGNLHTWNVSFFGKKLCCLEGAVTSQFSLTFLLWIILILSIHTTHWGHNIMKSFIYSCLLIFIKDLSFFSF